MPFRPRGPLNLGLDYRPAPVLHSSPAEEQEPSSVPATVLSLFGEASALVNDRKFQDAEPLIKQLLQIAPGHPGAREMQGIIADTRGDIRTALNIFMALKHENPDNTRLDVTIGHTLVKKGDLAEGVKWLERGLAEHPVAFGYCALSRAHLYLGNKDKAEEFLLKSLDMEPDNAEQLYMYVGFLYRVKSLDDPWLKRVEEMEARDDLSDYNYACLNYALYRSYSGLKDYDRAFACVKKAAAHKKNFVGHDSKQVARFITEIQEFFSTEFFGQCGIKGHDSDRLVFIVGMPRSGTSLLEQILHAHPDIVGVGEETVLSDLIGDYSYLQGVTDLLYPMRTNTGPLFLTVQAIAEQYMEFIGREGKAARCVVSKSIGNRMWAGFQRIAFPRAKFIHISRHAVDCCLSSFTTNFTGNAQAYSYDLEELGAHYRQNTQLVQHWQNMFGPDVMLDVTYEDIVADIEGQARRIISFLGLPWNEKCLEFHAIDKTVSTASVNQVRQPLYSSSIGRWKRYGEHLLPLIAALGDAAPEDARAFLAERQGKKL